MDEVQIKQAIYLGILDGLKTHKVKPTPWPHNMTETQWRHELAGRFATNIIIERAILASAMLIKAATQGRELDMAIGKIRKVPVSVEAYKLADAQIEEGKKDD